MQSGQVSHQRFWTVSVSVKNATQNEGEGGDMPRHKKTIEEHLNAGTFRGSRHAKIKGGFDTLDTAPPCPPSIISEKAIKAWNCILPILANSGRLASEDLPGLELAFRNLGMAIAIADTIQELDPIKDASKFRMLASTMDRMSGFFIDVLSRFGFSSKGRENLAMTAAQHKVEKEPSLLEKLTSEDPKLKKRK